MLQDALLPWPRPKKLQMSYPAFKRLMYNHQTF